MQLTVDIRNLIDRINQLQGLLPQERIVYNELIIESDPTNQMLSELSKLDFERVITIRNALYNGLDKPSSISSIERETHQSIDDLTEKYKDKFNIIDFHQLEQSQNQTSEPDIYFIIDDTKLSDSKRIDAVIRSLLHLINKDDIIHGDDIVIPYISGEMNNFETKTELGKTYERDMRKKLIANGFPIIHGYFKNHSDALLKVEVSRNLEYLEQKNYLAAAVYIALFEDKVLIGNSNPKEYCDGVLEYFVKIRNKEEDAESENKKKMAVIVEKPYILSPGTRDFCKKHNLGYVVLEVK
ncbi:hypothetical protein HZA96_07250 [Candidatus Woesearchaeota archaeon]|nr:hypothetical protein [Candidatus Woesearchaeota archaeon]